ncbi:hypothetical protein [Nocardiopsis sp. NPDC006938]|uniref:hypothetical protein n=1 Tax=Nocardiopsis sp. NPDC006938 TaxID=3364337 RepID=UPI003685E106
MAANTGTAEARGAVPVPWVGAAFATLTALVGLGVTVALWGEIPQTVPSGKVGLDGEPTMTPRWLFASAVPGVVLLLVAVVTVGARVGSGFQRALRLPVFWSRRSAGWLLDLHLALLSGFLLAVHVVILYSESGRDLPLGPDRLVALIMAAFLVGLGLLVPVVRTREGRDTPATRWWRRARWPVGGGVAAVGALTGAVGLLAPGAQWAAVAPMLLLPVILLGCAVPFLGDQSWRGPEEPV